MGRVEGLSTLPDAWECRGPVVQAEREPRLLDHILLFETPGDGEISHGLIQVTGEGTPSAEFRAGEGVPNTAVAPAEDLPIAPVPLLPLRSADIAGVPVWIISRGRSHIKEEPRVLADVLTLVVFANVPAAI